MSRECDDILCCCNCDDQEKNQAKFYCIDCLNSGSDSSGNMNLNAYFCTGCSIIHPRIKMYRNHQLFSLYDSHKERFYRGLFSSAKYWINSDTINQALSSLLDGYLTVHDKIDDFVGFHSNIASMGIVIVFITLYFYVISLLFGRITTLAHIIVLVIFNRYGNDNRKSRKVTSVTNRNPRSIINALSVNKSTVSSRPHDKTKQGSSNEDQQKEERRTGYLRMRTKVYSGKR